MSRPILRPVVLLVAAVALAGGSLAGCGDGPSKAEIERVIDANPGAIDIDPAEVARVQTTRDREDAERRDAEEARKRRARLDRLDRIQRAETQRILADEGDETAADDGFAVGGDDPAAQEFRARLSGICEGSQRRLGKVTRATERAARRKDAEGLLRTTADYADTLADFERAIRDLDAPPAVAADYRAWQDTVSALTATVRLTLVAATDRATAARVQDRLARLTTQFLEESAGLGVTCFSILA